MHFEEHKKGNINVINQKGGLSCPFTQTPTTVTTNNNLSTFA